MFGSNDRSRWATVKALVEDGKFVIGQRDDPNLHTGYKDDGILFRPLYRSLDVVMNPKTGAFYSSKPPLYTVIVAGEYWILHHTLSWTIDGDRWPVTCTILITFNVLPLVLMLWLMSKLIEEYGTTDWGRMFAMASACFGTFLTTFAVTLNNHTPAATCAFLAVYPLLRGRSQHPHPYRPCELLLSGFFAGMTMCLDLPGAALTAGVGLVVLRQSYRGLYWFVPMALLPIIALFGLNYLAIGEFNLVYAKFGGPWYEYPGSYWLRRKLVPLPEGIDFANEPKEVYAFHMLFGHHGLFSLTPIWILAFLGMIKNLFRGRSLPSWYNPIVLGISAIVIAFYVYQTNNYGGYTSGPRWQFWLSPLYIIGMIPLLDSWADSTWRRRIGYAFLGVSIFSACYAVWNPWRHPWILVFCEYMGWLNY